MSLPSFKTYLAESLIPSESLPLAPRLQAPQIVSSRLLTDFAWGKSTEGACADRASCVLVHKHSVPQCIVAQSILRPNSDHLDQVSHHVHARMQEATVTANLSSSPCLCWPGHDSDAGSGADCWDSGHLMPGSRFSHKVQKPVLAGERG